MKKTLKQWKELAAEKKAAWMKAKAKGIQGAELALLKDTYLKHQDVVDNAEADGADDKDTVEVDAKAIEAKGTKAADKNEDSDEEERTVDVKTLGKLITEAVQAEFAKGTQNEREQVTAESIKGILKDVLSEHLKEGQKEVNESDIKGIFSEVLTEQRAKVKKASKMRHDSEKRDDEENEEEGRDDAAYFKSLGITCPVGPSKGNLPLHQKQLLNRIMRKHENEGISRIDLDRGERLGEFMLNKYSTLAKAGQKALTSTGSGTGDEWVPTNLASELLRRMYLASELNAILAASEIDMPTEPYEYPLSTTRPTFYGQPTENTATTASTPATARPSLASKKFMAQVDFSYEIAEDSIIPILPNLQTLIAEAAADAYEDCLINGDTTGTHQDSDTDAITNAAAKQFKGFRKLALAITALKSDISSGGLNEANLRALKKILGKWGVRKSDLMWIVGSKGINDIGGITNVSTVDKYGPGATILTGEISTFLGIPIVTSERSRENLNASGVYDGSTTTKGNILLVNKSQFLTGRRREFTVELDRDITTQKNIMVASFRKGMIPMETPSASITTVAVGFNYTS